MAVIADASVNELAVVTKAGSMFEQVTGEDIPVPKTVEEFHAMESRQLNFAWMGPCMAMAMFNGAVGVLDAIGDYMAGGSIWGLLAGVADAVGGLIGSMSPVKCAKEIISAMRNIHMIMNYE